ncbi:MAG TPA: hypothetical protein DD381_02670 [Lentisphaeria bacterium]|nr:MAG: hypothetical protein A2X47_03585 [Lentisphaerae bacterium GWF2_38_69]HBM15238.1 hypothetical protein [Lentisphaeria bacterium]
MNKPVGRTFFILKTMDSYVLKEYLKILSYCFIGFSFILVSMDMLNSVSQFTTSTRPDAMEKAIIFYSMGLLVNFNEVCPLAILFACIYQIIKMETVNEVIALLGSGIRSVRIVASIYILASVISIFVLFLNLSVIPQFIFIKDNIFDYDKGSIVNIYKSIIYNSSDGERIWYIETFESSDKIKGVRLKKSNPDGTLALDMTAKSATYSANTGWVFNNVDMQFFKTQTIDSTFISYIPEKIEKFTVLDRNNKYYSALGKITETPVDFQDVAKNAYQLTSARILHNLDNQNLDQRFRSSIKTQFYRRLSFPFLTIFFIMIIAPYLILNDRTSLSRKVYFCFTFLISYFILNKICVLFGDIGVFPPFFAGILPTLVILALALAINMKDFNMSAKSSKTKTAKT